MDLLTMSASYRESASLLWERIRSLRRELESTAPGPTELRRLRARIAILRSMYSETCGTAHYLENYYKRRVGDGGEKT